MCTVDHPSGIARERDEEEVELVTLEDHGEATATKGRQVGFHSQCCDLAGWFYI
jgi:hypothetical protein